MVSDVLKVCVLLFFLALAPDAAAVVMLMPKKNQIAIYELVF